MSSARSDYLGTDNNVCLVCVNEWDKTASRPKRQSRTKKRPTDRIGSSVVKMTRPYGPRSVLIAFVRKRLTVA